MRQMLIALCALVVGGLTSSSAFISPQKAGTLPPLRKIQSNSVVSQQDPRLRIKLPKAARYVGADRWHLFEIADCEIHLFVEADKNKVVQKYYWIQFESYLPTEPNYVYEYKLGQSMMLSGLEFNVRARFGSGADKPKTGSDLEHVLQLLAAQGYTFPADLMNVRLVHLPDASKRKELMVIYGEDLAPTGFTTEKLIVEGKPHPQWATLEKELIDRAKKKIEFLPQK
jgi:hypothetical protein